MTKATPPGGDQQHWEAVYAGRDPDEVSWYQARPEYSLAMIRDTGKGPDAGILDIGGGTSRLVDCLLDDGYRDITVLDIAESAIRQARGRLGKRAGRVRWLAQDVTDGLGGEACDIWHDRAVFHFLVDAGARRRYLEVLGETLRPGGDLIMATFAPDGPDQCSGLPVLRYDPEALGGTLGPRYLLLDTRTEAHRTPGGKTQHFVYCRFGLDR